MQRIRILYVEDYDLVLFTVKQLLESESWLVDVCRDGRAALKKIESDEPYDLLILDEKLRGVGGLELIERARQTPHLRKTPIVMFTAAPCDAEAGAAGADAFLRKPGGLKDLLDTCRRLLKTDRGGAQHDGRAEAASEGVG